MKKRIVRNYVDYGCGFPVVLDKVDMVQWGTDEIPWINSRVLATTVLFALVEKPTRMSGNEVRFIRMHHEMKLSEFGKRFDVTHPAVKKWESRKDEPTGMAWPAEMAIRLFLLDELGVSPRPFQQAYLRLIEPRPKDRRMLHLKLEPNVEATWGEWQSLAAAS